VYTGRGVKNWCAKLALSKREGISGRASSFRPEIQGRRPLGTSMPFAAVI